MFLKQFVDYREVREGKELLTPSGIKLSASAARGGVAVYARINVKTKVRLVKYLKECSPVSSFFIKK